MMNVDRKGLSGILVSGASFVIIVAGMKAASALIVQLLLAIFIAVIITPIFIGMQRKGVPAPIAFLFLILLLVLVGTIGVTVVGGSLNDLARNIPAYQDRLQGQVGDLLDWLDGKGVEAPRDTVREVLNARNAMRVAGNTVAALSELLGKAFVILLLVIFILFEAAILPAKVKAMPGMTADSWSRMQQVVDDVRHYMGMKTLISLFTGLLVTVVLALLRVEFALLFGLLAFVLNYVPNIGSIVAAVPGVLMALVAYGPVMAGIVAVAYLVINVLIGNFLEPRVMGKELGLSPMVVVVSLILWGWVLGPVGMLLSVPLTMTVKIVLESIESTRGIAVMLGSSVPGEKPG